MWCGGFFFFPIAANARKKIKTQMFLKNSKIKKILILEKKRLIFYDEKKNTQDKKIEVIVGRRESAIDRKIFLRNPRNKKISFSSTTWRRDIFSELSFFPPFSLLPTKFRRHGRLHTVSHTKTVFYFFARSQIMFTHNANLLLPTELPQHFVARFSPSLFATKTFVFFFQRSATLIRRLLSASRRNSPTPASEKKIFDKINNNSILRR